MRRFELLQESHIVFGEHAQVFYLIFQVGNAFHPKSLPVEFYTKYIS